MIPVRTVLSRQLALALATLAGLGAVQAQESQAPAPANDLQSIVVTAQKRPQKLQEVPLAMSVVNGQEIENRGISGFTELLSLVPNTTIDQNTTAQPVITIRGISSSANNFGMESAVGVVIDDVFLGRPAAFSTQLIDIERVEVLRGSQGTLFGKNTTGGLVNLVTSRPSRQFQATGDLTGGSFGLVQARGMVTGPLGDDVAGKLSFTSKRRDGWVENRNPQAQDLMSERFDGVRGQLAGKFSGVSWLLSADHSRDRSVDNYYDVRSGALAAFDSDGADRSVSTNGEQGNDGLHRTLQGVSLKLEGTLGDLQWTSITAHRSIDWKGSNDQDYTELPILVLSRQEQQSQLSQELRLSGRQGPLTWLGGLYLFNQDQDGVDRMTLQEATPPLFGLPAIPGFQESADTVVALRTRSSAVFGAATYALDDRLDLHAGLRYTRERKLIDYRQTLQQTVGLISALAAEVAPFSAQRRDAQWSGDLGLSYKIDRNLNGYAKLTRGFKAGGFDTTQSPTANPGDLSFEPETVISVEAGLKSILAGGQVRLNAAVFHTSYRNKQEQFFDGIRQRVGNAARATIDGAEAELAVRPGGGWQLSAALGYQDARYDEYQGFKGNWLVDASRLTASASAQYEHAAWDVWDWMLRGDLAYRSRSFQQPDNDARFTQPGHTLANLSAGLRSQDGRYSLLLWVKNLGDKTYRVSTYGVDVFQTLYQSVNPPRMVGLEFRVNL